MLLRGVFRLAWVLVYAWPRARAMRKGGLRISCSRRLRLLPALPGKMLMTVPRARWNPFPAARPARLS